MTRAYRRTIIGIVIVAVYLFPVYWMVATSLKSAGDIFSSPPSWIPLHPQLAAYSTALIHNSQMLRALGNSAIISVGTMVLTVVLAAPAAYAFARLRLRFSGPAMLLFLIAQLLPSINLALPLFISFSKVGLVDSLFSLVLADTVLALPFAVIILRPFFLRIPSDLEEAAETDGCNRLGVFLRIVVPVVRPGLVTAAVFAFVMTWGEFAFGLTLTTDPKVQPVTVVLNQFIGQYGTQWGPLMAASTTVALPIVLIFAGLQRFVSGGLTTGSVKE